MTSFDTTPLLASSFIRHHPVSAQANQCTPCLLLAFVHIRGEAGTPTGVIWDAAVVGRNGPFLCAEEEGVDYFRVKYIMTPFLASFIRHRPSLHRQISAPRLLLAFVQIIQGEDGICVWGDILSFCSRENTREIVLSCDWLF
jgi:hypothetical protein